MNVPVGESLKRKAEGDGIQRHVVGLAVVREGYILLLRRRPDDFMGGMFELPSGAVEGDEDLWSAAARELKEETGLTLTALGPHVGSFDYCSQNDVRTRQYTFIAEIGSESKVVLSEHDAYEWVTPQKIAGFNVSEETRSHVSEAFRHLGGEAGGT